MAQLAESQLALARAYCGSLVGAILTDAASSDGYRRSPEFTTGNR